MRERWRRLGEEKEDILAFDGVGVVAGVTDGEED